MIWRWVRLGLGLIVVALGLYVILGEQFSGTSADAVINAQVLTLRAPIDGQLALAVHPLGARVDEDEYLASIKDPRPDDTRLLDLERTAGRLAIEVEAMKRRSEALQATRAEYQKQATAYRDGRVSQIEARLGEANSALEAAQARLSEAEARFHRSSELGQRGFQSKAELDRSRSAFQVATKDVAASRDRIRYLTIELDAARQGTFLGDSYNDIPYSQQRIQEIGLQLAELDADIQEATQRLTSLHRQVDNERLRVNRFTNARIAAPVRGILWEVMAANGEYVRKAQDVLRMVDCTSTIVSASVRESLYNRLKVGDTAQFLLSGNDRLFHGTVARLAGAGAESIYRSLAIGPSKEHLKRFDVTLIFPELDADPRLSCAVGRTGRVTFSAGPLEFWRRWLAEIGLT